MGSTLAVNDLFDFFSNHSHVCGINSMKRIHICMMGESFPRMWDQLFRHVKIYWCFRIIPTYVGSTLRSSGRARLRPNHSHVCGINGLERVHRFPRLESFPRMWDQRMRETRNARNSRIIPTYVGSTKSEFVGMCYPPNHSHVCGINVGCQ